MSDKRDLLEMDFSEISVVQAIALTLGASTALWTPEPGDDAVFDGERQKALLAKLEARVQEEVENATPPPSEPTPEDYKIQEVDEHQVSFVHVEEGEFAGQNIIEKVVVDGQIFVLACNERVYLDEVINLQTFCIKQFNHKGLIHEDAWGNER